MLSSGTPAWKQATAVVSIASTGAVTGFSYVPGTTADLSSPSSMPLTLTALHKAAEPSSDSPLRQAVVNSAKYYLNLAQTRSPAQMEALIWAHDSTDGADHGESCAAFASLMLHLGAQATGQESWVTGGGTYPWPLHPWADVRVNPNPDSLNITSAQQDAQAHGRWHPLGDGYVPQPGDWVLFSGHIEVITGYSGGTLYTIGGDSLPNFSVNAHEYPGPLGAQGIIGFVNNGNLAPAHKPPPKPEPAPAPKPVAPQPTAAVPGITTMAAVPAAVPPPSSPSAPQAAIPGLPAPAPKPKPPHHLLAPPHHHVAPRPAPAPAYAGMPSDVPGYARPWIADASRQLGLPASVVAAQNNLESSYGTNDGPSGTGAMGPWQFEPYTWPSYSSAPFSLATNWAVSTPAYIKMMHELLGWSGGNVQMALAAYNAGQNNWGAGIGYANTILDNAGVSTDLHSTPPVSHPAPAPPKHVVPKSRYPKKRQHPSVWKQKPPEPQIPGVINAAD